MPTDRDEGTTAEGVASAMGAEAVLRLLSEASRSLAESIDYGETLEGVARVAVPAFADWCAAVVVEGGALVGVTVECADPARGETARAMLLQYPVDIGARGGLGKVLRTGEPELYPELRVDDLHGLIPPAAVAFLHAMGLTSYLSAALRARGRILGALVFAMADSGRRYGPGDLAVAEDLCRRAALAIDNARLYRAARDELRVREDLLAMVSHDLQNPLSAVRTNADLLRRTLPAGPAWDRQRQMVAGIDRASARMARLVGDLLDLASLEGGRLAIRREPQAVAAIIADALDLHRPLAAQVGVALDATPVDPALVVACDRGRVLQVLSNLVGNAIKFTPRGGAVGLAAERLGAEACVAVRDDGPGIAADHLPRVFERFWRGPHGGAGTGLGLYIARALIEAHGGRIWVESGADAGSVFRFTLPAAR